MTEHKPHPKLLPQAASNHLPVPDYLKVHYWWAYVHPKAVRFFERQWLVNLILWGNYNRLRDAALDALGPSVSGRTLQVACAYGDITPLLVKRLDNKATLDIIDILPVQLGNLSSKLSHNERIRLHCMDSAALEFGDESFDQVLVFFLLHEQPADVREKTMQEAARVLKPGGRMVVVDYSKPAWWNPFGYTWKLFLSAVEPFAPDLFRRGLGAWLLNQKNLTVKHRKGFFGGAYELFCLNRSRS